MRAAISFISLITLWSPPILGDPLAGFVACGDIHSPKQRLGSPETKWRAEARHPTCPSNQSLEPGRSAKEPAPTQGLVGGRVRVAIVLSGATVVVAGDRRIIVQQIGDAEPKRPSVA